MFFKKHIWKILAVTAALILSISLMTQTDVEDEKGTFGAPIASTVVPP